MAHRTRSASNNKPAKPYPGFPLFPHATGRWAKKIRGKLHYFRPWADPNGALQRYLDQKDDLHAGRTPRLSGEGLTIRDLCNRFLTTKQHRLDNRELSPTTFRDYKLACGQIIAAFGRERAVQDLRPADFEQLRIQLAKRVGPVRLGNEIQQIRCVFRYAWEEELIEKPVRFGQGFKRPSRKTLRQARNAKGLRMFQAAEIRAMLARASVPLRAMILLGINSGFGNSDCGILPLSALDLESGWVDFARPKTGIPRRCALWPETVAALREALGQRPKPKDEASASRVFVTQRGFSWAKDIADSPITKEMRKLLDALGIDGHRNFYTLRHTFRTVADESHDQPAVDHIMGHESPHISSVYRERISDERLRAVTELVRRWLFLQQIDSDL